MVFAEIEEDNIEIENIHAGAIFQSRKTPSHEIILIETWNERYLMGWSWNIKYKLYSTWADKGGATAKEVCAYLRGSGFIYKGTSK